MNPTSGRHRFLMPALLVAFVVVPLIEIYVLIQVGQVIGAWWTILLLVADSILGSWLVKREGGRAWRAFRSSIDGGRVPGVELADGALILVGGTLMLTPGFVTDALGILLILPFTRPIFRRLLTTLIARRVVVGARGRPRDPRRPGPTGPVVEGEVVED